MEQENRTGCILHGCGVLAALAGLCAASGAALSHRDGGYGRCRCFSCWRWQAQPAACCCTQRAARCRYFVISEEPSKINFAETLAAIQAKYPR